MRKEVAVFLQLAPAILALQRKKHFAAFSFFSLEVAFAKVCFRLSEPTAPKFSLPEDLLFSKSLAEFLPRLFRLRKLSLRLWCEIPQSKDQKKISQKMCFRGREFSQQAFLVSLRLQQSFFSPLLLFLFHLKP
ncbi:MAG: hypothetical protein K9M51_00085 [Candidatus Gracilibacteria bacterium]|nr:hypothetical protein [Candidatus Gracilibacteria bacterium]